MFVGGGLLEVSPMTTLNAARNGLTKAQTRATLESFNWSLLLRGVFDASCAGGALLFVTYALALGIAKERMGLITVAVNGACILQIAALALNSRVRDKKSFIIALAIIEPLVMILAVQLMRVLPEAWRLVALAAAVIAAAAAVHLARPLSEEWVASSIPAGLRGRYLGRRLQILAAIVTGTTILSGALAQYVGRGDPETLGLILTVGGFFGVLAALPLRRASLPAASAPKPISLADARAVWATVPFRRWVMGILIINLPFYLVVPYYTVFHLEVLKVKPLYVALITVGYFLIRIATAPLFGRAVERVGPRRMMRVITPMYIVFFLSYPLSSLLGLPAVIAGWTLIGVADTVFNVATGTAMYAAIPHNAPRPAYFAIFNLIGLTCGALGALAGERLLAMFSWVEFQLGPWTFTHFHCFYALAAVIMVPCAFASRFFEGGSGPVVAKVGPAGGEQPTQKAA
jgi:MFS family permease